MTHIYPAKTVLRAAQTARSNIRKHIAMMLRHARLMVPRFLNLRVTSKFPFVKFKRYRRHWDFRDVPLNAQKAFDGAKWFAIRERIIIAELIDSARGLDPWRPLMLTDEQYTLLEKWSTIDSK